MSAGSGFFTAGRFSAAVPHEDERDEGVVRGAVAGVLGGVWDEHPAVPYACVMHSSEILVELVVDTYYRQFLAYGICGESVHGYLDVLLYGADAVRHDEVKRDPAVGDYARAVEQCRGHLGDGGYVEPCPSGEHCALSGVQGGVHGVDVDCGRAVCVEVGEFLDAEGVAVPDAAAQDGGEVVPGRGVVPLVSPLVPVDGEHSGIGAPGKGQAGDFDFKFGCGDVVFVCRVIREAGVEDDAAVGLIVPEGDFGCAEVVGYGFEHEGVVLGWVILYGCPDSGYISRPPPTMSEGLE